MLVRALILIVLFCFLTIYIDAKLRPTIIQMAEAKAQNLATDVINNAIAEAITKNTDQYKDILIFEKNDAGGITALRTNMIAINSIKTEITKTVISALSSIAPSDMEVPIGNLFYWNFLSGRGPSIPIRVIPVGSAETNFLSIFTSAGINQTKHRIVMESSVWVNIIMPGYSVKKEITTDVNVAETILVGTVPNSYTYIGGSGSGNSDKAENNRDSDKGSNDISDSGGSNDQDINDLLPKISYQAN
ncbi:MAG: sporulation protein YunB [Clostridiales bacterium]|nr:sporulation protein YunB [Clostridiales bacterium]